MYISSIQPIDAPAVPKLSVGYVLNAFPVLSETFVSNEIRAMRAQGHAVTPLALGRFDGPCQPDDECFKPEIVAVGEISHLSAAGLALTSGGLARAADFAFRQAGIRPRSLMLAGARVAVAARRRGITHLHAHFAHSAAATAIVAARLGGMTCSFIGHGYDIYGAPCDLALKLASADVAFGTCQDMINDFLSLAPLAHVRQLNCGVDPARFRRPADVQRNGRMLAIGRLAEQKGYPVLLAALAALPADRRPIIDIVGGGDLLTPLQEVAATLGVSDCVNFLGPKPSGWIAEHGPAYIGFLAPYCLTSTGDRDTGPLVVKEAMAMELPVVASALMGLKESTTPETGMLVPPANPAALASGLLWLAKLTEAERRVIGRCGRAHVLANYTIDGQARGLARAIADLQA